MNGVFCALDFFLFYVFWEIMLLPMYFLIGIWGGTNRIYAAIKFFLYTMAGSVLMLIVLLAAWYWSDGRFSTPEHALAAKQAVYEQHLPLLDSLSREEAYRTYMDENGSLPQGRLAAWMDWHHLDHAGITDLPAYIKKFKAVKAAKTNVERTAALNNITLEKTFDLLQLKTRYALFLGEFTFFGYSLNFAVIMFVFLFIAFAIKVPIFPFHTWLPWAHVEAPTAISVILAGILLKMGVYGFFRLAYPIFPTAAVYFCVPIALLGVFNIIYGACCAMAQDDMKKLVAYSSVSHMGYCMLGLAALTGWGMTGAVLQMFNHGTSTSMMFLLVGVIYDRAHHRDINKFGGLATQLPCYTGIMTVALFASMGLPGLSGFISEIMVFLGAFKSSIAEASGSVWHISFQSMTIVAAVGVVLTAAYLLWMMQRVFFGPLNEKHKDYVDLTGRELFTLVPLVFVVILFGVYPQPLINLTRVSVEATQRHVLAANHIPNPDRRAPTDAAIATESASQSEDEKTLSSDVQAGAWIHWHLKSFDGLRATGNAINSDSHATGFNIAFRDFKASRHRGTEFLKHCGFVAP
ncbi:MAG: NADH-quinone oxidoreductase subunit M [Planctomycetota bacterium]